jgi:hypothetical protein
MKKILLLILVVIVSITIAYSQTKAENEGQYWKDHGLSFTDIITPAEYVHYTWADRYGKSIESCSFVIWNNTYYYIFYLRYRLIISDPNGKIIFKSKPYEWNNGTIASYFTFTAGGLKVKNTKDYHSEQISVYFDKPVKSKWQIWPNNHLLKIKIDSLTYDSYRTAENIAYEAAGRFIDNYSPYIEDSHGYLYFKSTRDSIIETNTRHLIWGLCGDFVHLVVSNKSTWEYGNVLGLYCRNWERQQLHLDKDFK